MATPEERDDVELRRLIEETRKFTAEQHKLMAERDKLRTDRWLAPVVIVFGAIGSLIGGFATIRALLHAAGIG
jgi:hypothetical protein